MKKCWLITLITALGLFLGLGIMASASELGVTTNVYGGSISDSVSALTAGSATLTGKDGTSVNLNPVSSWKITDARGTGQGWTIVASASILTAGTKQLPGTVYVTVNDVHKSPDAQSSSEPDQLYVAIGQALTPANTTLFAARSGEGMGSFEYTPVFTVKVPARAYAGNYSCDITTSLYETGPIY